MPPFDPLQNGPWLNAGRPVRLPTVDGSEVTVLIDLPEKPEGPLVPVLLTPAFGRPKEAVGPIAEALISDGRFIVVRPSLIAWGDEAPGDPNRMVLTGREPIYWGRFLKTEEFRRQCGRLRPGLEIADRTACVGVSLGALMALQAQAESGVFDAMCLISFVPDNREFTTNKTGKDYYDLAGCEWALRLKGAPQLAGAFSAAALARSKDTADPESSRRYRLLAERLGAAQTVSTSNFSVVVEGVPLNSHLALSRSLRGLWDNEFDAEHQIERSKRISIPLTFINGGKDDFGSPETLDRFIVGARESQRSRRLVRLPEADHYLRPQGCFEQGMREMLHYLAKDLGLEPREKAVSFSLARMAMRRFHEVRGFALRHAAALGAPVAFAQKVLLTKAMLTSVLADLLNRPEEVGEYVRLLALSQATRGDGTTILSDLEPARLARIFSGAVNSAHYPSIVEGLRRVPECIGSFLIPELIEALDTRHIDAILLGMAQHPETLQRALETIQPRTFSLIGRRLAMAQAQRAARLVPAYRDFLEKAASKAEPMKLEDFPVTERESYVSAFPIEERCIGGNLPPNGSIDESSGSSGTPTNWIRCQTEEDRMVAYSNFFFRYLFGCGLDGRRTILLNAFSQGAWASATKLAILGRCGTLIKNIGTDMDKLLSTMRMFGDSYRYILAGYPPFLRELVLYGRNQCGISWSKYRVDVLHGGEGYTEGWTRFMKDNLGPDAILISSYGVSDLDVGIAVETPLAIAIRKKLNVDAEARKRLLGSPQIPVFLGQYNPAEFFLEERLGPSGRRSLVATVNNPEAWQPRVRYDVGDEGGLIEFDQVGRWYAEQGAESALDGCLHLPFVYLLGRLDGTISLDGANVYPSQVQQALLLDREIGPLVRSFRMRRVEEADGGIRFEVDLELFAEPAPRGIQPATLASDSIVSYLCEVNGDYKESFSNNQKALRPVVNLVKTGGLGVERRIKHRYVE